jgi:hypothetical protein
VGSREVDEQVLESLERGGFDGLHHLWCKRCHPEWDADPRGVGVGNPFTAWCGVRAVILARWLSDETPPGACPRCADPSAPCATCGWLPGGPS